MDKFKDKKVLILGLGLNQGGVGATKFFAKQGAKIRVTDLKSKEILQSSIDELNEYPEIEYTLGEHKRDDIDWAEIIIRNPGFRPSNEYLKYALSKGKVVLTDLDIFFEMVDQKKVIAITGTKGKSTTSSLIHTALEENNQKSLLVGNIGKSVLDAANLISDFDFIIVEVSSFQLQNLSEKFAPKFAVITNIFPDHLNYHKDMDEYITAKKLIAKDQTSDDFLFLRKDDPTTSKPVFIRGIKSTIIYFTDSDIPENFSSKLKGEHNKLNLAGALAVVEKIGISKEDALKAFSKFAGNDFRLQLIKEVNGIKIYNDSASTNPKATVEALKTFPNSVLIVGGMNKGMDFRELANAIDEYAKQVYFIEGDATEFLKSLILNPKSTNQRTYNNLEELLQNMKDQLVSGDSVLFSPGATSFNLFQNEFDRGRRFNSAVEKIFS